MVTKGKKHSYKKEENTDINVFLLKTGVTP